MEADEPQPDSLDGWVAVREHLFEQPEAPQKLRFLVAWNPVESKFAVTCHNRTLQEQAGAPDGEVSWAGSFAPPALRGLHRQLAALEPRLEAAFPALPAALSGPAGGGLWALLFPSCPVLAEAELEALCRRLERYLDWALELCGRKVLLETLFGHDREEEEEYFENLQEFRRKALKGRLSGAKEALRRVRGSVGWRGRPGPAFLPSFGAGGRGQGRCRAWRRFPGLIVFALRSSERPQV